MKTIAILTLGFGLAAGFTTVFATNHTYPFQDTEYYAETAHDWECKYIVEDFYTQEGGSTVHYVDEIVKNVDGSITFIGEDGLLTTIPYPYYSIEENPKEKN